MKKLTVQQIDEALLKLMDENPDYVYRAKDGMKCSYHEGEEPECHGCIFGQALQSLGVTKDKLRYQNSSIMIIDLDVMPCPADRPRRWNTIQFEQDAGKPWGELREFLNN